MSRNQEIIQCPTCDGSGACPHCGGKGSIGLNLYVEKYAREAERTICSFCRKKWDGSKQLSRAESGVTICSECIDFINGLMEDPKG